jgi:hypothetical protein
MKGRIKIVGSVARDEEGSYLSLPIRIGTGPGARTVPVRVPLIESDRDPVRIPEFEESWVFKNVVVRVEGEDQIEPAELMLRIKHAVYSHMKELDRLRKDVEAVESLSAASAARREPIPESARMFVWRRDEGKCVICGSNERLEFDHIIPVAEGGSNTERNLQLLCEPCNRAKGKRI